MKTLKKILLGLTILIVGFIIGSQVVVHLWKKQNSNIEKLIRYRPDNKVSALLHAIDSKYVDQIDMDSLIDKALPILLEELDPHSAYYSSSDWMHVHPA